jgi:hypothetical protein
MYAVVALPMLGLFGALVWRVWTGVWKQAAVVLELALWLAHHVHHLKELCMLL